MSIDTNVGRPRIRYIRRLAVAVALAATVTLSSCSTRLIGHGVVLWSPDESRLETGAMIGITETLRITNTYVYLDAAGTKQEIATWRVRFFEEESEAAAFAERYGEFERIFARVNQNGLPVRNEMSRFSERVYRLQQNEEIKVLDRSEEMQNEGGLIAYWYNVLTSDGTVGWVFGHHLTVYDSLTGIVEEADTDADPFIEALLTETWRPEYYRDMIDTRRIDLARFTTAHGLFPDPDQGRFTLVLPDHTRRLEYSEIREIGARQYELVRTSAIVTFHDRSQITLRYPHDGSSRIVNFVAISRDIEEIIAEERERRDALFERLVEHGETVTSANYGRIRLLPNNRFVWRGFELLVRNGIVPQGTPESGSIDFPLFLPSELSARYDGALAFRFDDVATPARFLYTLEPDGVRLRFIPDRFITDALVTSEPPATIVIFFTRETEEDDVVEDQVLDDDSSASPDPSADETSEAGVVGGE